MAAIRADACPAASRVEPSALAFAKNDQTLTLKVHLVKRRSAITKTAEGWQKAMVQADEKLNA